MKQVLVRILTALLVFSPITAFAQQTGATGGQGSVTGIVDTRMFQPPYACDQTFTATGAANTTVTLTSGTPPTGTVFYLCTLDINTIANAAVTGAAGPALACATTNLLNNLTWWGDNATYTTGQLKSVTTQSWPLQALKSLVAGTAFTVACSGGQSTYNVRANMTGFFAKP